MTTKKPLQLHVTKDVAVVKPSLDVSDCRTLPKLEAAVRGHLIEALVEFVRANSPLTQQQSTKVWLRSNGTVVAETVKGRLSVSAAELRGPDLLVEIFAGEKHATPNSPFHDWRADNDGPFFGILPNDWSQRSPHWEDYEQQGITYVEATEEEWEMIGWKRFSIAPVSNDEIVARISGPLYEQYLEEKVDRWLFSGAVPTWFEQLNYGSFKLALGFRGARVAKAVGGRRRLNELLIEGVRREIQSRAQGERQPN